MADYLEGRIEHVDRHLSNIVVNYRPTGMIWDRIAPIVSVPNESDSFLTFDQADMLRRPSTLRSRGAEAQKVRWGVSSDSFRVQNYALMHEIPIEDIANSDPIFRLNDEANRAQRVADFIQLDAEARIGSYLRNTSNVGSYVAVASAWTNHSVSKPFNDLFTAIKNVEDSTGYRPNRAVFGRQAWRELLVNDQMIDKTRGTAVTGADFSPSTQLVASLLELDEVLVGGTYINSADEAQALSLQSIWGYDVLVYYAPKVPSMDVPSFMYTSRWAAPEIPNMYVIRHPYDSKKHVRALEVGYYQAEKIVSKSLSFLIRAVGSSQ